MGFWMCRRQAAKEGRGRARRMPSTFILVYTSVFYPLIAYLPWPSRWNDFTLQAIFLPTWPLRKPRTLWACHRVARIREASVAPEGCRSKARIFSVLVPVRAVWPWFDRLAVGAAPCRFEPPLRPCLPPLAVTLCTASHSRRTPVLRSVNLLRGLPPGSWFHTSTSRAAGHCFATAASSSALRKMALPAGASCSEENTRT